MSCKSDVHDHPPTGAAVSSQVHTAQSNFPTETNVLIIGGGPAGLSAAYTCQTLGVPHLLLEAAEELGGQLRWTHSPVIGVIGSTNLAPADVCKQLVSTVIMSGCFFRTRAAVIGLDVGERTAIVSVSEVIHKVRFKSLILATGASERRLGVAGEELPQVFGAHFSTSRSAAQFANRRVVVVGGGDRALEGALHLALAGAEVFVIHRRAQFRARPDFEQRVWFDSRIHVVLSTVVEAMKSDEQSQAVVVTLRDTSNGRIFNEIVDAVVVRIGMAPQNSLIRAFVDLSEDGTVLTDRFLQTSQPGIYAVGDASTPAWGSSVVTAIGHGALAVRHASHSQ